MDAKLKPSSLVRRLFALPAELVHQILSDLPVSAILNLANHDTPYVDDLILSHIDYRHLFSSKSKLTVAKSYYRLYATIFHPIRSHASSASRELNNVFSKELSYQTLLRDLHWSCRTALSNTEAPVALFNPALYSRTILRALYDVDWYSSPETLRLLQERWITIQAAQQTLNALPASQLRVLADLMEAYPRILKRSSDPSQEQRVSSDFVYCLRLHAKRISKLPVISAKTRAKKAFHGNGWLPIVPYDKYLRLFLKVLRRHPLAEKVPLQHGEDNAKTTYEQVTGHHSDNKRILAYSYPSDVAEKVRKAIIGLERVYTPENLPSSVIRTKYTLYSDTEWLDIGGLRQPMFAPEVGPRVQGRFVLYREEEMEWLEAFLESCKFMSGMSEVRWSATETVAEMWERKSSL